MEGVLSVARKVRSCSEASCAALEGNADFGLQSELLGFSRECGSLGGLGVALEVRGGSVRVERWSEWDGVVFGVRWEFWVFRDEVGAEVFMVKCGVCWMFRAEVGDGLRWWLLRKCRGGVWGAESGCGDGSGKEFAVEEEMGSGGFLRGSGLWFLGVCWVFRAREYLAIFWVCGGWLWRFELQLPEGIAGLGVYGFWLAVRWSRLLAGHGGWPVWVVAGQGG